MAEIFIDKGKKINIIKKDDDIWFRAKTVAYILKYSNQRKAIIDHVDSEDKCSLNELKSRGNDSLPLTCGTKNTTHINETGMTELKSRGNDSLPLKWSTKNTTHINETGMTELKCRGNDSLPLTWNTKNTIYINESGLYSLILRSDMDKAK